VESIDNHGLMLPMIHDAHDGKLYYYGSLYAGYGRVLNTVTKEILAMEAFNDADRYPYCCVPVLGCPVAPFMLQYAYPCGRRGAAAGLSAATTWPPSTTWPRRWKKPLIKR